MLIQRQAHREGTLDPERRARLETVPGWVWDAREARWEEGFTQLLRFVEREGHARVPQSHREDGLRLGGWVMKQRQGYREGKLDPARRARLEALPGWVWDPDASTWEDGFAALRRFVEREGHARVPRGHCEEGVNLAQWILVQRQTYRGHRGAATVDPQHRARLEAMPGWAWDPREARWEEGFAHLRQFVEREGHGRVPARWRESDFPLGGWVDRQRLQFREGELDSKRRARLEAVRGWSWAPFEEYWERMFGYLKAHAAREGTTRIPESYREHDENLGKWVSAQRRRFKRGRLDKAKKSRLENLSDWTWDPREADWEEGFAHLQRFVEREGHARVPSAHREDGYRLGGWVVAQRRAHRTGILDPGDCTRLEALPSWAWDPREADWEEGFAHLQSFVEREGHARVPYAHREGGYRLGQWTYLQRAAYHGKRWRPPTPERRARLEALPGWTWASARTSRGARLAKSDMALRAQRSSEGRRS